MTYAEWIEAYCARTCSLLGKCREAVTEMRETFPELRIARGHVHDGMFGKRGHWWLVAPSDEVVDPTAAQFPAIFEYEEWSPGDEVRVGACMDCGADLYAPVQSLDDEPSARSFCDAVCQARTEAYLNGACL